MMAIVAVVMLVVMIVGLAVVIVVPEVFTVAAVLFTKNYVIYRFAHHKVLCIHRFGAHALFIKGDH